LPLATANPHIGQITLKVNDIDSTLDFYKQMLNFEPICHEPVNAYKFHLHFLAANSTDIPPCAEDLSAQINREWTYQRSYTTIELYSKNKDISTNYGVSCP